MKKIILLFAFACFLTSCNVTESIVFDNNMSGQYITAFDMAPMMEYANKNRPASKGGPKKEKIDTTIVFDDLYKTHKDSIAALSDEQRAEFKKLKGMVLKMQMDEEKSIFKFEMSKKFKAFDELKTIYDQTDEAMDYVKNMSNKDGQAPQEQVDGLTSTEKVTFSFENNTFSRFQLSTLKDEDDEMDEEDMEAEDDPFKKQMEMQFEEVFSNSFYTLTYRFPKKVKSVSSKDAVISEDGKTVTYKVSWNAINGDASIMNLDVVLED
ncbi:hypothetical protein [Winogradskyella sp.]|uniref:hypothetical protein n=1 Tax=Winogradskyella sp. TaxID=1883156 RepID=UPI0025F8ACF8|nr:hypothetical protein [Winogradskyella sp.]